MGKGDPIIAGAFLVLGIFITIASYGMGLWTSSQPGVGLMPFGLGILLVLCSFPLLIGSWVRVKEARENEKPGLWADVDLKKIAFVIASLVGYLILLEKLGFLATTFLVLFALFKTVGSQKWRWALIATVLTVSCAYLLFIVILDVYMPPFPFWVG